MAEARDGGDGAHDALPNDVTLEVVATLRHCDEGAVPS